MVSWTPPQINPPLTVLAVCRGISKQHSDWVDLTLCFQILKDFFRRAGDPGQRSPDKSQKTPSPLGRAFLMM